MAEVVGLHVVGRGVACLGAREVESHDRQSEAVSGIDDAAGQRHRGGPVDLFDGEVLEDREQILEVGGESSREHPHGAGDQAVAEGGEVSVLDGLGGLVFPGDPVQAAIDRCEHIGDGHVLAGVELGGEAELEIADTFGETVLSELVGHRLEGLVTVEYATGVGEPVEVVGQVSVLLLEDQLSEAFGGVAGELDLLFLRELDQGREAKRAIEVAVQVGLGEFGEKFVCDHAGS